MKTSPTKKKSIASFLTPRTDKQPAINSITGSYNFLNWYTPRIQAFGSLHNTAPVSYSNSFIDQEKAESTKINKEIKPKIPSVENPMFMHKYSIYGGQLYKLKNKQDGKSYEYQPIISKPVLKSTSKLQYKNSKLVPRGTVSNSKSTLTFSRTSSSHSTSRTLSSVSSTRMLRFVTNKAADQDESPRKSKDIISPIKDYSWHKNIRKPFNKSRSIIYASNNEDHLNMNLRLIDEEKSLDEDAFVQASYKYCSSCEATSSPFKLNFK